MEVEAMRQNHKKLGNYVWKQRKTQKGNFVAGWPGSSFLFGKKYQKRTNTNIADRSHVTVWLVYLAVTLAPANGVIVWVFHGMAFFCKLRANKGKYIFTKIYWFNLPELLFQISSTLHTLWFICIYSGTYTGVADCLKDIAKMSAMFSILHKHI